MKLREENKAKDEELKGLREQTTELRKANEELLRDNHQESKVEREDEKEQSAEELLKVKEENRKLREERDGDKKDLATYKSNLYEWMDAYSNLEVKNIEDRKSWGDQMDKEEKKYCTLQHDYHSVKRELLKVSDLYKRLNDDYREMKEDIVELNKQPFASPARPERGEGGHDLPVARMDAPAAPEEGGHDGPEAPMDAPAAPEGRWENYPLLPEGQEYPEFPEFYVPDPAIPHNKFRNTCHVCRDDMQIMAEREMEVRAGICRVCNFGKVDTAQKG